MKCVDTIARIRREFFVAGKTIKQIVRELHVSRNTVRKVVRTLGRRDHQHPVPTTRTHGAADHHDHTAEPAVAPGAAGRLCPL